MKKSKSKLFAIILGVMGLLCIVLFFVYNMMNKPLYTISFDTNGGSIIASITVEEGKRIIKPSTPTKEGYDFLGWNYKNSPYDFNLVVKENMTLNAVWEEKVVEPEKYIVTFKLGDVTKTVEVEKYSDIDLDELGFEQKSGQMIIWYIDGKEYDDSTELKESIILEGKYVKIETYTIKFKSNGGTSVKDQKVKTGEKVLEPENVTREGYILDGWYLNSEKYDFNSKVNRSFTLTAKWSEDPNVKWYTVSFDTDGGKAIESQRIMENKTATKPSTPTKNNLIFDGWYYNDKPFDFKTKITSDMELKAKWREPNKYQVTFQKENGEEYAKKEVLEGETVSKPDDPTKDDYDFKEWQLDGQTFNFDTKIYNNITLKPLFVAKEKNCTVSFDTDGGSNIASKTIKCGSAIEAPSKPTKENYEFFGWLLGETNFDFSQPITSDITLKASWKTNAVQQ